MALFECSSTGFLYLSPDAACTEAKSFYPAESLNNVLNKNSQMFWRDCFLEQNNWEFLYDALYKGSTR